MNKWNLTAFLHRKTYPENLTYNCSSVLTSFVGEAPGSIADTLKDHKKCSIYPSFVLRVLGIFYFCLFEWPWSLPFWSAKFFFFFWLIIMWSFSWLPWHPVHTVHCAFSLMLIPQVDGLNISSNRCVSNTQHLSCSRSKSGARLTTLLHRRGGILCGDALVLEGKAEMCCFRACLDRTITALHKEHALSVKSLVSWPFLCPSACWIICKKLITGMQSVFILTTGGNIN